MVVFENLFNDNNWEPINYKGRWVSPGDTIVLPSRTVKVTIRFEQVDSDWEQGVFLRGKGTFFKKSEQLGGAIYLWQKGYHDAVDFLFESKDKKLKVWNIWRIDNGPMQYGHNGGALYFEETKYGKRYFCNDGYPDDDFNDLIFSIEIVPQNA